MRFCGGCELSISMAVGAALVERVRLRPTRDWLRARSTARLASRPTRSSAACKGALIVHANWPIES